MSVVAIDVAAPILSVAAEPTSVFRKDQLFTRFQARSMCKTAVPATCTAVKQMEVVAVLHGTGVGCRSLLRQQIDGFGVDPAIFT